MKVFLIVDDSPVIRKVANRILSDSGFVCVEAGDCAEALNKCNIDMPDAILLDWETPGMSGLEFLEELSRLPGSNNVRILYCTSELMVSEMTKAKRAGANAFMMKPFNREILHTKVKEIGLDVRTVQAA